MIKQLLLTISLLFAIESNAQQYAYNFVQGSILNYQPVSLNQHQFRFQTSILDYFVPTFSSTTEIIGDVLEVKMYYDITEQVFSFGNLITYNNLVDYNQLIASNVTQIKMSTNVIMLEDNPPYNPIAVDNLYFRIFDLNNLSVDTHGFKNKVSIYPNPAKENITMSANFIFDKAIIVNNLGQHVNTLYKNKEDIYDVQSLSNGIYYVSYYTKSNDIVGVSKLIKQN
jgi:hypothetical protein